MAPDQCKGRKSISGLLLERSLEDRPIYRPTVMMHSFMYKQISDLLKRTELVKEKRFPPFERIK